MLRCSNCGSNNNINVTFIQTGGKTNTKGKGILFWFFRQFMIFITLGLWRVWGQKLATSKVKYKNHKMAVCNSCGNSWRVK